MKATLKAIVRGVVAWLAPVVLGVLAFALVLWHLHAHHSYARTVVGALALACGAMLFSRYFERDLARAAVLGSLRAAAIFIGVVGLAARLDYAASDPAAWGLWIPAQALAFAPLMVPALPRLAALFTVAWLVLHVTVVARRRQAPFLVPAVLFGVWSFVSLRGFYRNTFTQIEPAQVKAQPGVRVVLPNPSDSCTFFQDRCSARSFPRSVDFDPVRRRLYACYGSTDQSIGRTEPKLVVTDLVTARTWIPQETGDANQMRHLSVDPGSRFVATTSWAAEGVSVFDADTLTLQRRGPRPAGLTGDFVPSGLYVDGDHAVLTHIYPPVLARYDLTTGIIERQTDLRELGFIDPGGQLERGVVSRTRRRIWLPVGQAHDQALEIDLDTLAVVRRATIGSYVAMSLALDDAGGRVFYGHFDSDRIEVLGLQRFEKLGELRGIRGVRSSAFDAVHGTLLLVDYLHGSVLVLDLSSGAITRSVLVGPKPDGIVVVDNTAYVNTSLGVVAVSL